MNLFLNWQLTIDVVPRNHDISGQQAEIIMPTSNMKSNKISPEGKILPKRDKSAVLDLTRATRGIPKGHHSRKRRFLA